VVSFAADTPTGHAVWIDHSNGLRSGYFHLRDAGTWQIGQRIDARATIGLVGDNPADVDGRHLHFELSPVDRYAPMDPEPYLIR
jgi:murein DD-endopeptidase MepM/ murein hydrolase activator NlpD